MEENPIEEIKTLLLKAKAQKQRNNITEAIELLNQAHEIGIQNNAVEDLVDIHNQLILLHYLNNDTDRFRKSYNFSRTLALRINYNRGLVETFMNIAWIETDNKNFVEAITHASEALALDDILDNAPAFTTALYIVSEANYHVGDIEKAEKYKRLYQKQLMKLTEQEEQMIRSIEGLATGISTENDLDARVRQALDELDSF
ncbi:MAG: hypothetical protein ACFFFG_17145 [Candidatus Thorarchaeota archaeon]